ncbi:hypothetical protein DPEC_G00335120 [Dallia pectoralis]|uniref:Uncharacterized protein n=1 Tax=Dallia pectoralis TaxID=75939 RepID=A0ACC2F6W3_DALPE|nr:hypothetical protein DPEC_G00335120 [Dallia pectoralis]
MATKPDVKAMMARFSSEGQATEGVAPARPKVAVHPTLSSGSLVNQKKPYIETSLSGGTANTPPKPNFLKSTVPPKVAPDVREPAKTKAIASMFEKSQEDSKPSYVKQQNFKTKTEVSQDAEVKNLPHKPPFQKPPLSSPSSDIKPAAPKAATAAAKPSWVKDATPKPVDSKSSPNSLPAKLPPTLKPVSSFAKMRIKSEDNEVGTSDSTVKSFPPVTVPKPSNVRTAQNAFKKADAQSEDRAKEIDKIQVTSTDSCPPIKPPATKKPSFKKPMSSAYPAGLGNHSAPTGSSSGPKKAPLPNSLALGTAPAKPNRPPRVNLEKFKRGGEARAEDVSVSIETIQCECIQGPAVVRKGSGPPPPASHPSTHVAPPSVAPSLPPRPPGASVQPDLNDSYDDVGVNNRPPLPSGVHPSQRPEDSDDGSETYEDLDERWEAMESKEQEKKREKDEKKRQEAEKNKKNKKNESGKNKRPGKNSN